jgi:hypothetical protein
MRRVHVHTVVSDPRAPRFVPEKFDILNLENKDFYQNMKKVHPNLAKYNNVDIGKCINILNKQVANEIIINRDGIKLPEGLGIVIAMACKLSDKYKKKNIDTNILSKTGDVNIQNNLHSDNFVAKIKYTTEIDKHMFENHDLWCWESCRPLMRSISDEFKKGNHINYAVSTTYTHMAQLFRKTKIKKEDGKKIEYKKKQIDNYDEFAF